MADIFSKILSKLKKNSDKETKEIKLENYITEDNSDENYGILFNGLKRELKDSYIDMEKFPKFNSYSNTLETVYKEITTPIVLMVMGKYTIGKKTFINNFLGEEIIKSNAKHGVSVFLKISYGPKRKAVAYYKNDTNKEFSLRELKSITIDTDSKNPLRASIKYVEVFLPKKILKEISLIQSPGLALDDKYYIKQIKSYLKSSDIGYWVTAYGKKLSPLEVETINTISEVQKPTLLINKINEIDEDEEDFEKILNEIKIALSEKIDESLMVETVLSQGDIMSEEDAFESNYISETTKKLQSILLKRAESIKSKYIHSEMNNFFEKIIPEFNKSVNDMKVIKEDMSKQEDKRSIHEERKKYLKPYYDEGVKVLKKKDPITTDFDLMFDAWRDKNQKEYEKIKAPLNYITNMQSLLKELKVNERVIYNIKVSMDLYDDIQHEIKLIEERVLEFKEKEKELTTEGEELNKRLDEYYASGVHNAEDKEEDWDETRKELETWRIDLNKRIRGVDLRYMGFEEDRRDQFKRVVKMNEEIYGYIDEYNKIVSVKVNEQQEEINECNNKLKALNSNYDELRVQVSKVEKILNELKSSLS